MKLNEMANQVVLAGLGISTAIGIGGDPIIGSTIIDLLTLFEKDKETEAIVIIGEIGGDMEIQAAEYIKENITKPVVAFIAGRTAPKGKRMGHAGAIIAGSKGTAQEKMDALTKAGVTVVDSPADIGVKVRDVLNK
jgi:succinyl-CoA synthetase alpha subunit